MLDRGLPKACGPRAHVTSGADGVTAALKRIAERITRLETHIVQFIDDQMDRLTRGVDSLIIEADKHATNLETRFLSSQ